MGITKVTSAHQGESVDVAEFMFTEANKSLMMVQGANSMGQVTAVQA